MSTTPGKKNQTPGLQGTGFYLHSLGQGWEGSQVELSVKNKPRITSWGPWPPAPPQGPAGVGRWHRQLWAKVGIYSTPFMNSRNSVERRAGMGQRWGPARHEQWEIQCTILTVIVNAAIVVLVAVLHELLDVILCDGLTRSLKHHL